MSRLISTEWFYCSILYLNTNLYSILFLHHSQGTQMLFTMGGVFYEVSSMGSSSTNSSSHEKSVRKVLRCFTRTMILIAPGGHIVQDDYIVSNPTTSLCKVNAAYLNIVAFVLTKKFPMLCIYLQHFISQTM